jgi:glycosyltransferase involved in cell wall biosynthesis
MRDNLNHTNTKKLSVITVTYNAEHTLERTLKSVREQTYPAIEHIIVDGNSNDGTVALIHRYENERLKWISEPDKGLYDAMNKGIKMATGDYLCFLNAGEVVRAFAFIGCFYGSKQYDFFIERQLQFFACTDFVYGAIVSGVDGVGYRDYPVGCG